MRDLTADDLRRCHLYCREAGYGLEGEEKGSLFSAGSMFILLANNREGPDALPPLPFYRLSPRLQRYAREALAEPEMREAA